MSWRQRRARRVRGCRIEGERDPQTSMRPSVRGSRAGSHVLVICQCMAVREGAEHLPCDTCRPWRCPWRGSRVIPAGRVMNGPHAGAKQRRPPAGDRGRVVAEENDSPARRRRLPCVAAVGDRLSVFSRRTLRTASPSGGAFGMSPTSSRCRRSDATPKARHMPALGTEWFDSERMLCGPVGFSKRSAGPPARTVRSTISVPRAFGFDLALTERAPSRSR